MAKSYRKDLHGTAPYYDDYNENKKFVRIMSRPGFPLQAREVTQLQTILQDQIERMGDHFFEEGAVVKGGEITEGSGIAIRLSTDTIYTEEQLQSFRQKTIKNDSGVRATIIAYATASPTLADDPYQVLFVNYTAGSGFLAGETLTIEETLPLITPKIKDDSAIQPVPISQATNIVAIASGVFYADGFLLKNDSGSLAVFSEKTDTRGTYRNFASPSAIVGFDIERELITSDQDETLKDPSFGFYNFNSPGADRYKINLKLTQVPLTSTDLSDFFELIRIDQGNTSKQVRYTDYAIFEDTLARRTYDESGHYTVSPFQVVTLSHEDAFGIDSSDSHAIQVSPGKAYVNGYEFETIAPYYFAIKRAYGEDHVETIRAAILNTPLKNYVSIEQGDNAWDADLTGVRDTFANQRSAILVKDVEDAYETLGSCNIRTIQEMPLGSGGNPVVDRGEFRLSLFNIKMNENKSFKDVTDILVEDDTIEYNNKTRRYRISTLDEDLELKAAGSSRQIFKAPIGSGLIKTNRDDLFSQFIVRKPYTFDMPANGSVAVESPFDFEAASRANFTVWYTSGGIAGASMVNIGVSTGVDLEVNNSDTTTKKVTITPRNGLPTPGEGTLIATQRWTSDSTNPENNIRTKTVKLETSDSLLGGDVNTDNESIVYLPYADVFDIESLTDQFGDVTSRFDLDTNQTNEAYFRSRLILKAGFTCGTDDDTGKIKINTANYKRFTHSGEGPFTVDSYPITDDFTYDDIPVFTDTETGEQYSLADAYDFRPISVVGSDDKKFDNGSGVAQVVALSSPATASIVSYEHYMSRIDKLVLDSDRSFKLIQGIPSTVPVTPVSSETQMVLGEFKIPPYTATPDQIKYRHIDNQRTTMAGINELEQTQQFDQYWTFIRDLESSAINRTQAFRPDEFVVSSGLLVDTFIGHNNAITAKRDHNCSIYPEDGTLRPAFESSFHHMGLTGADLGTNTRKTTDNIYMLSHTETNYSSLLNSSDRLRVNQTGLIDYLGSMSLSPSSDPYFSTTIKPKVIINVVGEVDNWENNIVAYQRGRTRGFGSQWRDWESIWFGSKKRNDINIPHSSGGSDYSSPRRSSFVSRVLSDKITRKIGNRIVDLSVVPYARSRTVTFTAKNLKPFTRHSVYFDGTRVVQNVTTDENGYATGSFDIPRNIHLTGKIVVRIQDQTTLPLSVSSADAIYYAEGLLETKTNDIFSIRPAITKRKSANSEDVSNDYFDANADGNFSRVYNSVTPLAQEIYVDPTNFRNGIMLSKISLFFQGRPEGNNRNPIKLSIRPMYQGAPHPYKVLPFSEVTVNPSSVVTSDDYSAPNAETDFEFSTPVYLRPGKHYAICLSTNSPDYWIFFGANGQPARGEDGTELSPEVTITRPTYIRRMHLPSNNGKNYEVLDQYFKMKIQRCVFDIDDSSDNKIEFTTNVSQTKPFHAFYVHNNEQVTENVSMTNRYKANVAGDDNQSNEDNINLNTTISDSLLVKLIMSPTAQFTLTSTLDPDPTEAVSPMIDGDRFGMVAADYMANKAAEAASVEELSPTARIATNRSRYISRKVTLEDPADDMVVLVEGTFNGNSEIKVFVKTQGPNEPSGNFDDNNWQELYPEGIADQPSAAFSEIKPTENPGTVRFTTDRQSQNFGLDSYSQYQIKIVLMGQNAANTGKANEVPVIESIAAVPLRLPTQDTVRRYIPSGTIMSTGRDTAPPGFLLCDGEVYNQATYPELFAALGTVYNTGGEEDNQFRVPDLTGRVPLGVKSNGDNTFDRGNTGGTYGLVMSAEQLPPHTHKLEPGSLGDNTIIGTFRISNAGGGQKYASSGETNSWLLAYDPTTGTYPTNGSPPPDALATTPFFWASDKPALPAISYYLENEDEPEANDQNGILIEEVATNSNPNAMRNDPIVTMTPYTVVNYIIKT